MLLSQALSPTEQKDCKEALDAEILMMQTAPSKKVYCHLLKLVEMKNLASGSKKLHGVLAHQGTKRVCDRKVGDIILFISGRYNSLRCELTSVQVFANVGGAFEGLSFKDFVPQFSTKKGALQYYCHLSSNASHLEALTPEYVESWDSSVGNNPSLMFYVWSFVVLASHFDDRQITKPRLDLEDDEEEETVTRASKSRRTSTEASMLLDDNIGRLTTANSVLERRLEKLESRLTSTEKELKELKKSKPPKANNTDLTASVSEHMKIVSKDLTNLGAKVTCVCPII